MYEDILLTLTYSQAKKLKESIKDLNHLKTISSRLEEHLKVSKMKKQRDL